MSKITPPPRKLCAIIGIGLGILNPLFAQNKVDLGNLATKNANGIKYIAVGSSLSAGVRDGGVYAEAQQTSFPALLAQQMGIKDFKQPLLDGNGTGKKTASMDKNGILKFTETPATYNDKKKETKLPKVTTEIDNLAVPYQKVLGLGLSEEETESWLPSFSKKGFQHLARFIDSGNDKKQDYKSTIDKRIKQADLFTYELGMQDFIELFNSGGYLQDVSFLTYDREGYFPEDQLLRTLLQKGAKGVVANVPEIGKLPYYNQFRYEVIRPKLGHDVYIERYTKNDVRLATEGDVFLPATGGIDGLLNGTWTRGGTAENPILDEEVIGVEERWSVGNYNTWVAALAKNNNLPLVDLYTIYDKILKGEFMTDDGVVVNPAYPNGTFFSADGIHPTAFGQAVIANEFIKVINQAYNAKIPLLKTKNYLAN
jgi:GDSL-like Lipase/Acylhydrolase